MIRVLFFGTPDFSVPSLKALYAHPEVEVVGVITQPDKPAGRGAKLTESPVKQVAGQHGTPVLQPISIRKAPTFFDELGKLGPIDLGVVIAFGQILPQQMLDFPRAGCVNLHASLLPRWRGAAPIQRALLAGDPESGVCLMKMEAGLDTGPVYSRLVVPNITALSAGELHDKLAGASAELLAKDLAAIVRGEMSASAQPSEGVTYAEKIRVEEAQIQWSLPSETLGRVVRAFSPFPGAFTFLDGKRLKVLKGKPLMEVTGHHGRPGTISFVAKDRLEVACGEGVYRIEELQLEGKKRMAAEEFLRGHAVAVGAALP